METPTRSYGRTPKLQVLCSQLRERAVRLGAGAKMPTVIALRDELGVSMATLDAALRELETQQVITRKHGVGIFVSPQLHQKSVSLVCDSSVFMSVGHSPVWDILLGAARERARLGGERFELHLAASRNELGAPLQRGLARDIAEKYMDGVIGVGLVEDAVHWIEGQGVPFVSLFGPAFSTRSAKVNIDSERFLELGAQQLAKHGCHRVALWPQQTHDYGLGRIARIERDEHWARLCRDSGLEGGPASYGTSGKSQGEQGFELASACFSKSRAQWPDGVLMGDDVLAHGALMAMRQMNVRAGTDVRVVSHANKGSAVLMGHDEPMTLLEIDPDELIEHAFRLLESLLRGETLALAESSVSIEPQVREVMGMGAQARTA